MLLQKWIGSKPNFVLAKENLGEVDNFRYLKLRVTRWSFV